MKIVILLGSPNRNGSTHLLAECFRQGATMGEAESASPIVQSFLFR